MVLFLFRVAFDLFGWASGASFSVCCLFSQAVASRCPPAGGACGVVVISLDTGTTS